MSPQEGALKAPLPFITEGFKVPRTRMSTPRTHSASLVMTRCGRTISRYLTAPQYGEIRKQKPNNTDSSKSSTCHEGDRRGERAHQSGTRIVVDRTSEMTSWVDVCKKIQRRGLTIYGYFNNHYAGCGPASVQLFHDMWVTNGLKISAVALPPVVERTLFN